MGEEDEAARDAIGETPEPPPELDHFLRFLVTIVDKADVEVGVTLNVGGLLVSGLLVGYDKYAEGVVSQLKEAGGSKEANAFLEEAFKRYAEVFSDEGGDDPVSQLDMDTPYVHLGEARFFAPGSTPLPIEGVWWRGRLSEVEGFMPGTLTSASG
jgi:hypothetical protein